MYCNYAYLRHSNIWIKWEDIGCCEEMDWVSNREKNKEKGHNTSSDRMLQTHLSTSSLATISPFFRALMAYIVPVFLYSDNNTWERQSEVIHVCNNMINDVIQVNEFHMGVRICGLVLKNEWEDFLIWFYNNWGKCMTFSFKVKCIKMQKIQMIPNTLIG